MYDVLAAIADADGIFLRADALNAGLSDRALQRALRAGAIYRIRHGAYTNLSRWNAVDRVGQHLLTAKAVLRQARTGLALSHTTAAAQLGAPVWGLPLKEVHVTRLSGLAARREAGVAQHQGELREGDLWYGRPPVTSPTRTALDLTTIADVAHCLPVLDHFLHTGQTTKEQLLLGAHAMRFWPDTLTTELVIKLADGRRQSVGESRTFIMIWRNGTRWPEPQVEIFDASGVFIGAVDFAWRQEGVFLEFDGKEKYQKFRREGESVLDVVLREKKREEIICRVTGWRCIRIVWADLDRPEETMKYIHSVLAGGPVHR